ncbi:MAG: DUF4215 domain-containing protein [Deltaproteobacteria bacterium]|nr:DUF4215 domain-containing protein [Deltaproteobacteria bacterium]
MSNTLTFSSRLSSLVLVLSIVACGSSASPGDSGIDAATPDSDVPPDGGRADANDAGPRDGGADADGGGVDSEGCRVLALGRPTFHYNLFNQLLGVRYPIENGLADDGPDFLLVELYDSTTPDLPTLEPGMFDLGEAPNDNLATCQHCVWVEVDELPGTPPEDIYYAASGTLDLETVQDPLTPVFAGTTGRVVLRRATVVEGRSTFTPGGDCVSVPMLAFDTRPTPGRGCLSAEDCGNPLLEVCDPRSNVCGDIQCGDFMGCPDDGDVCLTQFGDRYEGACYRSCDPTSPAAESGCAADQSCDQHGVEPTIGVCKTVGEAALGDPCELEDNGSVCGPGLLCSSVTGTCTESCRYFDEESGCPDGTVCSLFGVCEPPSSGDAASFDEPCDAAAELASGCAADGEALRGICFAYDGPLFCREACLGDRGCEEEEFCALRFGSGLGICLPDPVCGDGETGEVEEICDDGNTASGDGCSGDCRTVEHDVLCGRLPALEVGTPIHADTATGPDGFQASCQLGVARTRLYRFVPPGPGRLRLLVESATDHGVSVRTDCATASSEVACESRANAGEIEELVHQVTPGSTGELTVVVSPLHVLEEGPFELRAEFVAQDCGDGIVAGDEVCDDGNETSDDGCSGDCRRVEYDAFCRLAQPLVLGSNVGDTTGAPELFDGFCLDPEGMYGTSSDVLYRFVAPSDGTLSLRLMQGDADLALVVLDGCGTPEEVTELACSAVYGVEAADVPLSEGQDITVVIDGFVGDVGPYELTAEYLPASP